MTIPKAVPARLVHLTNTFASQLTWQNTSVAANTLEAMFYASLRGGVMQTGRLVNWLRETSIGYVSEIQTLFNLANIGFIALSAKKLLDEAQGRYGFSIAKDGYRILTLKSAAVVGAVFLGWKLVNSLSTPLAKPKKVIEEEDLGSWVPNGIPYTVSRTIYAVDIAEKFSTQQRIAKCLHITKLVLNVATACFMKNRFWSIVSLAIPSYSLWKNIQLKWITFTRTSPFQSSNPQLRIPQLKPTYYMLALPPSQSAEKEGCGICYEDKIEAITFCANHVFCKSCLTSFVHKKSTDFFEVNHIRKTFTNDPWKPGHYSIKIDQKNLPRCPLCNDVPLQNTLSMEVTDQDGKFNTDVTWKRPPVDRQYLFENLYAIYNTAQTGLAFLQTYPELAGTIHKIQKVMLVTDFIGNALTTFYLFNKVNAKFNPNNSMTFKIATVATIGLIGVLSWHVMLQVNLYLKSAIILHNVLNQMGLSADVLKTLNVHFSAPMAHKVMQALLINRIMASAALTFFSKQKKTSLLTVTTQLASLLGISALTWIEVVQTLDEPLQKVIESGGKLASFLKVGDVKSSQVIHRFLISSSCLAHLQSTMKSITDFTVNFFNKSSWDRYLKISHENGIETAGKRYYSITLQNNALEACDCTLIPHLDSTEIKVDALYAVLE